MSKTTTRKFKCMKCDEVYDIETFDSVNVTLDPDLKDKVSSGDIFYKECPHCHNTYMLEYPCLYHDMERKFMVWLMKEEIDANIKNMYTQVFNEQKQLTLRRCEDIKSFLEKIEIFNNGLDDRAIEFAKYDAFVDFLENKKGSIEDVTAIYFSEYENDIVKINIQLDDKGISVMYPYDALLAEIETHENLFGLDSPIFPIIDSKWIIQIFEAAQNKA